MEVKLQIVQDGGDEIKISEPDTDNQISLEVSEDGQEEYTTIWLDYTQALKIYKWLDKQLDTMQANEKNQAKENG